MPIGEAHKSGGSFTGLAEYILAQGIYKYQNDDKKPEVVFKNQVYSSNYLELGGEFREVSKYNKRVTKPVMHLTVNFKSADNISDENQKKFVRKIIDEMGVKENNHQFLVVKHNDKHPHYHIQINRVGFDGKTLSDSNSKLRIGTACDKVEKEMGLDNYLEATRAFVYDEETKTYKKNKNRNINKGLTVVKPSRNRQVGIQEKKDFIQIETLKALDNNNIDSLEMLQNVLKKRKILFKYSVNKKEQVAVSFQYNGLAVKGSKISLKGSLIKNQLLANQEVNKELENKKELMSLIGDAEPHLIKSVDQIRNQYNLGKTPELKAIFEKNEITYNEDGNLVYKDLILEDGLIKRILEEFNDKLEKAKVKHVIKLKEYKLLQQTEFKKGFLGILNEEQKKFNKTLKRAKEQTKPPLLEVAIKGVYYTNLVIDNIYKAYSEVKAKKVTKYVGYLIDESIDLTKNEGVKVDEKKKITFSTIKNELEKLNSIPKNKTNEISESETEKKDLKQITTRIKM
jgi:hypothetical protein